MTLIMHRRGTSTQWVQANPVLLSGELGYETNTGKFKMGNGIEVWVDLPYFIPEDAVAALVTAAIGDDGTNFVTTFENGLT